MRGTLVSVAPRRACPAIDLLNLPNVDAFARRFRRLVGEAPLAYLTWWRLNLAARWLRDTGEPIAVVAGRVGYGSEYSFSRAFTRHHGQPPGRYRRQSRELEDQATPMGW